MANSRGGILANGCLGGARGQLDLIDNHRFARHLTLAEMLTLSLVNTYNYIAIPAKKVRELPRTLNACSCPPQVSPFVSSSDQSPPEPNPHPCHPGPLVACQCATDPRAPLLRGPADRAPHGYVDVSSAQRPRSCRQF
ncbi:uncharacterized protein OGAPODRAFT_16150 [Ogataea polymorpha]|uniref:uncharacterized protein n=1 Tax=Ogataea polymorpha TaxID=460523 RepID=UPI0007F50838|nr:uncharacterized protein OGAPODRAFT_16150 [Ogataea polymorpha]OBA16475.1 hypothetical protein OGAPODRAFT_16150 [Ogataea polymorpha]